MTKHNLRRVRTYIHALVHDAADAAALLFDVYEYMLVFSPLHRACKLSHGSKFFLFLQDVVSTFDNGRSSASGVKIEEFFFRSYAYYIEVSFFFFVVCESLGE